MASIVTVLFGGVFLAVGLGIGATGIVRLRKWWLMRSMDPTEMVIETGVQEFEGRAHAIGEPVMGPFSGSRSVVCASKVERYDYDDDGSNWDTVTSSTDVAPFEIRHSGATVAVDPTNAQQLLTEEFQVDTGKTADLSPRVQEFVDANLEDTDATLEFGPIELGGNRYRFTEERLDEGEDVYVLGSAERDPTSVPGDSTARLVIAPEDYGWRDRLLGDPFVVADTGEKGAIRRQRNGAIWRVLFGLVFAGAGLAVILLG